MNTETTVVITGAGSGLGKALSQAFSDRGATVIGLGRSIEKLEDTKTSIQSDNFSFRQLDVSDFSAVTQCFEDIAEQHNTIDVLFNNAAIYEKVNFLDESAQDWADVIATNINGVANCCKAALPYMIKQSHGKIYNLGSWADKAPIKNSASYSASKGALHALTKAIAQDISDLSTDIEIHEWIPGHLNTQMSDYTGIAPEVSANWGATLASKKYHKNNCIFVEDYEWQPPKSLKQRLKQKLFFWK